MSRIGSSLGSPGTSPANCEGASSLDDAIDVVAREMTNIDAPARLRADVLVRIEETPRSATALLPRWAIAAGMAVVVLAVTAAVWLARPGDRPGLVVSKHDSSSTQARGGVRAKTQPLGIQASVGVAESAQTDARPGGAGGAVARAAVAAQPDQTATAAPEMGPAALGQPEPIAIAALGPNALHIPAIGIEPLGELKPITIQDLPVDSGEPQSPSIQKVGDQPVR